MLVGSAIFAAQGLLRVSAYDENHRVAPRFEVARTRADINGGDTSGKDRADYNAGPNTLLRFEERFHHSMDVRTARHTARHLRDDELRKLQFRMSRTELGEHFCNLFWRGDAQIGDQAAVQRFRIIEIQHTFSEIGAVVRSQMEMRAIWGRVVFADQGIVLLRRRFDFESIDGAIVRGTDELVPVSPGTFSIPDVGSDVFEILAAVTITQERGHFRIGK